LAAAAVTGGLKPGNSGEIY